MTEHIIDRSFAIDHDREDIFDFFASAENLERLTPPWLNFKIISSLPIAMKVGTVIEYKIKNVMFTSEALFWAQGFGLHSHKSNFAQSPPKPYFGPRASASEALPLRKKKKKMQISILTPQKNILYNTGIEKN